jgi:hypothetical protein
MSRRYPPDEVARYYRPIPHHGGWAVQVVATGELLTREDGSPRVSATWEDAEESAHGTLRVSRAMQTGFATGLLDE